MIVGYTDRIIRVYGWNNGTSSKNSGNPNQANEVGAIVFENSWELPDQVAYKFNKIFRFF